MASIYVPFVLEDRFSNPMAQCIRIAEQMSGALNDMRYSMANVETATASAAVEMQNLSARMSQTTTQGNSMLTTVRNLAGAFLGMRSVQWLVGTSDQLTQINARLQLMTGSAEAAAEANDQIYQAAMRARGAYTDMADLVSQLGTLAGNAFTDTGEIVAFAEQLQKQMALSGTSTQAAQAAMLQLTQGLSSGTLRGEELNSVLGQTPMIAQSIAEYMGVTTGEMRELASEGALTADVVKNAILGAAEETDAAFRQMPMTWGQVWNMMQNMAIKALEPVLGAINWVANNLDVVAPIVLGIAAAIGVYAAAMAISNAVTWLGVAANRELILTMLKNPFLWVAATIGVVISAIAAWVQSVGGLEMAWLIAKDTVLTAWEELQYGAQWVTTGILNSFGDMAENTLILLQEMANGAIDVINWMITQVNKIPGVSIDAIQHVTFGTDYALENMMAQSARTQALVDARLEFDMAQFERNKEIAMRRLSLSKGETGDLSQYTTGIPPYDEIAGTLGDISGSVKNIDKTVSMSDEDIKALVDVAERRYVNQVNLTSQTPMIIVNGANTGRTAQDRRALADAIEQILREEWASGSVRSTAYA